MKRGGRFTTSSSSHVFEVPSNKIGIVIGRKGAKVRELEQKTNTQIKINSKNEENGYISIELFGQSRNIDRAQQMIEQLVGEDYNAFNVRTCNQCGETGHIARNCPSQHDKGTKSLTCYKCGNTGHMSRNCPAFNSRNSSHYDSSSYSSYNSQTNGYSHSHNSISQEDDMDQEEDWEKEIEENPHPTFVQAAQPEYDNYQAASHGYNESKSLKPSYRHSRNYDSDDDYMPTKNKKDLRGTLMWAMRDLYDSLDHPQPEIEPEVVDFAAVRENQMKYEKMKFAGLPAVIKNFYIEHPDVTKRSELDVSEFRKQNNDIQVVDLKVNSTDAIPKPVTAFKEAFHAQEALLKQIHLQGFKKPSPIQSQAWPILLQGRDLIGIAQTGTGKTLAFLLPAFIHICGQTVPREEREGPTVLILCPTRELALQIEEEIKKIKYKGISCVCLYGGGNRRKQIDFVSRGVDVVVATPGRLNDLMNNGIVSMKSVSFLVLDEADRMLDLGFEPQIRLCMLDIRPDRQTVMTSATWPADVQELAERYMSDPIQVYVGSLDLTAVHSVHQKVEILDEDAKKNRLFDFICYELTPEDKAIVFVGKKVTADDIASDLAISNIACRCIHGDREQADREQCLRDIKTGECKVLIATDVASRGLDVKDITYVFNYDFPRNIEEYVHRIGRTGRAGNTGTSITLLTRGDWRYSEALIKIMEEANQEVPKCLHQMAMRYAAYQSQNQGRKFSSGPRRIRYNNQF